MRAIGSDHGRSSSSLSSDLIGPLIKLTMTPMSLLHATVLCLLLLGTAEAWLSQERRRWGRQRWPTHHQAAKKENEQDYHSTSSWQDVLLGNLQPRVEKLRVEKKPVPRRYSAADLEAYTASSREEQQEAAGTAWKSLNYSSSPLKEFHLDEEEEAEEDHEALFLDPEEYVSSSRDGALEDGSLKLDSLPSNVLRGDHTAIKDYGENLQHLMELSSESPVSPDWDDSVLDQDTKDVWESLQRTAAAPFSAATDAEELHRQVFANEEAYLNQSQVFRESLTNSSKAPDAYALRRRQRYWQRQQKAIDALERQIEEFEVELQQQRNNQSTTATRCAGCNCLLAPDEVAWWMAVHNGRPLCRICHSQELIRESQRTEQHRARELAARLAAKEQQRPTAQSRLSGSATARMRARGPPPRVNYAHSSSNPKERGLAPTFKALSKGNRDTRSSVPLVDHTRQQLQDDPWVEMEDPDSGEIFYWNKETDEMRWEI
jgi:hypothetical protein